MHDRLPCLAALAVALTLAACGGPEQPPPSEASELVQPTPAPAVLPTTLPAPSPTSTVVVEVYTVRRGDTLSAIADRFNISVDELMRLNGLSNPDALQVGQALKVTYQVTRVGPPDVLIPDSEAVYSPAYMSFDVPAFANQANGYLASYHEKVEGDYLSGPEIVQLVSERYSVGPRVLLTLLELQGEWVTSSSLSQTQITYPMGLIDPTRSGLFFQVSWAANHLNEGYYGKLLGRLAAFKFKDNSRARLASTINSGTAAVENVLAQTSTYDAWLKLVGPSGFAATYRRLFGDPNARAITPLVPPDLKQPLLVLPWNNGSVWYFTGGPHSGWGDYTAWSAIDLTPNDSAGGGGCWPSREWARASAPGRVIRAEHGRVLVSLSDNNFQGEGWVLIYMHMAPAGRVDVGTEVNTGDPIGHPSCEGGTALASHLHFGRLYNGQWIGPETVPFVLSGWSVTPLAKDYDGKMTRGAETKEACDCRNDPGNAITADVVEPR